MWRRFVIFQNSSVRSLQLITGSRLVVVVGSRNVDVRREIVAKFLPALMETDVIGKVLRQFIDRNVKRDVSEEEPGTLGRNRMRSIQSFITEMDHDVASGPALRSATESRFGPASDMQGEHGSIGRGNSAQHVVREVVNVEPVARGGSRFQWGSRR
ncbi:MAG: hypothetical protein ABL959_07960 [Pyrinomonadaceae bacterium]